MATLRLRDFAGPVELMAPAPLGAAGQSLVVDRAGWDTVMLLIQLGAASTALGVSASVTPVVKVSDAIDGPWEAPDEDELDYPLPVLDADARLKPYAVEYLGTARYLMLDWTAWVGTGWTLQASVLALRGGPRKTLLGDFAIGQAQA